jgi:hypothetical protein
MQITDPVRLWHVRVPLYQTKVASSDTVREAEASTPVATPPANRAATTTITQVRSTPTTVPGLGRYRRDFANTKIAG